MKFLSFLISSRKLLQRYSVLFFSLLLMPILCITGCGGTVSGPVLSGNTEVTIFSSSTANDQLVSFGMVMNTLKLQNENGETVNLIPNLLLLNFMSVNGRSEPMLTVNVPQGIYTSAAATVGLSGFVCISRDPSTGSVYESYFTDMEIPNSNVTVILPGPLVVTGSNMNLVLDLQVSQSASWGSCISTPGVLPTYSITPTFTLSSVSESSSASNADFEKQKNLLGFVAPAVASGNSFTANAADGGTCPIHSLIKCDTPSAQGPVWQVTTDSSTIFQGITGISQLANGMPLDMDAEIQLDGSLLASRVAVYDTNTDHLTTSIGSINFVAESEPGLVISGMEEYGPLSVSGGAYYDFDSTLFALSGQFANLESLPFTASFASSNVVAGQNVQLTTHALSPAGSFPYTEATTITLLPQTINGTVSAISTSGRFTTYTVTLAAYDLFPDLAVQAGQTTVLTNPNTVVVYADSSTQQLNTDLIAVGSVVRFNGLVFNDNGTLRMDCGQISDGVAE